MKDKKQKTVVGQEADWCDDARSGSDSECSQESAASEKAEPPTGLLERWKRVPIDPAARLSEAIEEAMRAAHGRLVDPNWIARALYGGGWRIRFGDLCDLGVESLCNVELLPGREKLELYRRVVSEGLRRKYCPEGVVRVREGHKKLLCLAEGGEVEREALPELFDSMRVLNSEGRFVDTLMEGLFAQFKVSALALREWRKNPASHRGAYPQELAIEVVARLLNAEFRGEQLQMREWHLELQDAFALPRVGVDKSDLLLRSRRRLHEVRVSVASRKTAAEALFRQVLLERFGMDEDESMCCFGLFALALYGGEAESRTLQLLQWQFLERAKDELHADDEQMRIFAEICCVECQKEGLNLQTARQPAVMWCGAAQAEAVAPKYIEQITLYGKVAKGGVAGSLGHLRVERYYELNQPRPHVLWTSADKKRAATTFFFRVRAPCTLEHPLYCLATTDKSSRVAQGEKGATINWPLGTEKLRLVLSRNVVGAESLAPEAVTLVLREWSGKGEGVVLVLCEGYLMGEAVIDNVSQLPIDKKANNYALRLYLGSTMFAETILCISRLNWVTLEMTELDPNLPWAPQNLVGLVEARVADFFAAAQSGPAESGATQQEQPRQEQRPQPLVHPSVAQFVRAVALQLAFGKGGRPRLSCSLRMDDLASASFVLQQHMQHECNEAAADARDRKAAVEEDEKMWA